MEMVLIMSITTQIIEIEDKIYNKILEYDRLLYKKMRGNFTFDESKKMHEKLIKISEKVKDLTSEKDMLEKLRKEERTQKLLKI